MSVFTIITTHAPYGQEKPFTALRLAQASFQRKVNVFLLEDGVFVAKKGQESDMRIDDMLKELVKTGSSVILCQSCVEARGISKDELIWGARIGTMKDHWRRQ